MLFKRSLSKTFSENGEYDISEMTFERFSSNFFFAFT